MDSNDAETAYNSFYTQINSLLNTFYPLKSVSVSNHDPEFIMPNIKLLLRKKNNLMRRGLVHAADCIAERIRKLIVKQDTIYFLIHKSGNQGAVG